MTPEESDAVWHMDVSLRPYEKLSGEQNSGSWSMMPPSVVNTIFENSVISS